MRYLAFFLTLLICCSAWASPPTPLCFQTAPGVTSCASPTNPFPVTGGTITSGVVLGTSTAATNPQRSSDATTGFYSAGSGLVDVSSSGSQEAEFSPTGIEFFNPFLFNSTANGGASFSNLLGNPASGTYEINCTSGTNCVPSLASSSGVTSFSFGTTGLTPSTQTTGAVVAGGTLGTANGGTGATTIGGLLTNIQSGITNLLSLSSGYLQYYLQSAGGTWVSVPYFALGGYYSFTAYYVGQNGSLPSGNIGTALQAALLDAQLQELRIAGFDFRNELLEAEKMDFVIESIPNAQIGQTITIPNLLRVKNHAVFQVLHSGTATSPCNNTAGYFDGSACANLSATSVGPFIPAFIVAQGAETENLSVDAADPSSVGGDGIEFSGAWEAAAVAVQATGTSYPNTFNASTTLVDKWGAPVNMSCTASGGAVTGCSLTSGVRFNRNNGIFNLPPALQKTQWCNSTFISAVGNVSAFDAGCNYYTTTTGGAGTGLTVSITWFPPYCTGSSGTGYASCTASNLQQFLYSAIGAQTAEVQKYPHITNAGNTLSNASYGDMYAAGVAAQNEDFLDVFTQGGGRGLYLTANATDDHIIAAYGYLAAVNFTNAGTNNVWIGPTSDSPTQTAFDFQKGTGVVHGLKLYANSAASATSSNTLVFGDGNVTWGPLNFDVTSENSGAGGSAAFASVDYMGDGVELDFTLNNNGTFTSSNFITFGSHNTANSSSKIRGVVDGMPATNFCLNQSNAINAVIAMDVWDAKDSERIIDGCVPESANGPWLNWVSGQYYPIPIGSLGTVTETTGGSTAYMTCLPRQIPPGTYIQGAGLNITANTESGATAFRYCEYPDLGHGKPDTQPLWMDIAGSITATTTGAFTATTFETGATTTTYPWRWFWDCLEVAPIASGTLTFASSNGGSGSASYLTNQFGVSSPPSSYALTPYQQGYNISGVTYGSACPSSPSALGTPSLTTSNIPLISPKRL